MSDRHASGVSYPAGSTDQVSDPQYDHARYGTQQQHYGESGGYGYDPLGTTVSGTPDALGAYGACASAYGSYGGYGSDPYGQAAAYDSGQFDITGWDQTPAHGVPQFAAPPAQPGHEHQQQQHLHQHHGQDFADSGQYPSAQGWDTGGWDSGGWGTWPAASGGNDWDSGGCPTATGTAGFIPAQPGPAEWENTGPRQQTGPEPQPQPQDVQDSAAQWDSGYDDGALPDPGLWDDGYPPDDPADTEEERNSPEAALSAPAPGGRGRRRQPKPRRSALLTVAAPSLCVLGVTAVATAAAVGGSDNSRAGEDTALGDADPDKTTEIAANQQFNTQLEGLTAAADDYAGRASRTQGRIDLEKKKAEEARKAKDEAERIEAARPKFFLPVEQRGLSAVYGQSGINWMSTHTGIDFPVSYGTPVRAATDGTIRTQWHVSYGNLMIITAPDGTETWYAHLSSYVYYSGTVQAGTVVAYTGNSGNSIGPHLHFEVRPGGGSTVDPVTWLRDKGLEPS
ncbi:M23 family metallopeptidase [Streptomyces aidingensis]|uniref:Murein DD-endopeptidase MepM and murein hydrolase activator NlpD, contain LysM domain n=1 Tax=Streptomyces aidingensis TaxID=910347 RepID=A0A1I1EIS7_9ACTN|nr:M23 family metallopeptidase [Streptomyces aidingensis]SFB84853.1 Murein DD-endopeptidase MepM and murein hydrolase activator NlpD, contain LysM domain [Streptomyces aidingensis]